MFRCNTIKINNNTIRYNVIRIKLLSNNKILVRYRPVSDGTVISFIPNDLKVKMQ